MTGQKQGLGRVVLVLLMALTLVVAAACGPQPPTNTPGDGSGGEVDGGNGNGQNGDSGSVAWHEVPAENFTDEVQEWIDAHKEEVGIFQDIVGDETLILVAWGKRSSTGYNVAVEALTESDPGELQLFVRLTEPADDDAVGGVITYPYALIAVTPAQYYDIAPLFDGALFLQNSAFRITEPNLYAVIGDTLKIEGQARVFEANFHVYLEDGHRVLVDEVIQADAGAPTWGSFAAELPLSEQPSSPNGLLVFYEGSAKDGTPVHSLTIPVQFERWEK